MTSSTPSFDNNEFRYGTLDPSTPIEIEEYSDLYDDYLDSPDSQSNATMNSGAAVYEQSVIPSEEDLNHFAQPSGLNIRNHPFISDDSLDSSFGINNNNHYYNNNNNTSDSISFKTPQFSNNNSKFSSPRTPLANIITPKKLDNNNKNNNNNNNFNSYSNYSGNNNSTPSINNTNNLNHSSLGVITPIDNSFINNDNTYENDSTDYTLSTPTNLRNDLNNDIIGVEDDDDNYEGGSYDEDYHDVIENNRLFNRSVSELENSNVDEDHNIEDDDDDDDDYDDEEVEKLRLQSRLKNQQIYSSNNRSTNSDLQNKNDATIITKSQGKVTKTIRKGITDFKLGKELGEGSYSTVVLGIDIKTKKKYAIKILNKRHIIKEKKVKYVNIEKSALNRLGKRNGIIGLHFTFQDSQSLYFVLDFAEHGELLSLIKKFGTMNEECTKHYTVQLIDAIDYMHKNGVIHRDLKPENILLDKNMKLQITDFGTAKLLEKDDAGNYPRDTRANSFVGTAEYVSPELLNDKYCGKPADIWALGCIIYQMIAGKPPFKATNEYLTFQKVQKLQYAFTAGFPIVIRDLIKRILILKPRERLTILDIKHHLWFDDINWNNQIQIWNTIPPNLGPYKITAKAMKPRPELDLQYPNGSSTSVQNMKKSKSTSFMNLNNQYKQRNNSKTGLSSNNTTMRSVSAASAPVSAQSPKTTPKALPKKKKSASSAATAALYGNSRKTSSSSNTASPSISTNSNKHSTSSNISQNRILLSKSSNDLQQITAERIIKSRQQQSNDTTNHNTAPTSTTTNNHPNHHHNHTHYHNHVTKPNVDVIPGTNIPRPVLNTKIPTSRSNTVTKSRNNSSLKTKKKVEVPQLSVLDLKWVQYLKHHDERVIKVGLVEAIREKSSTFEKKYKGLIIESPLGYKNKDNINQPQLFSNDDDESIRILDTHPFENEINDEQANEFSDAENESSVNKFKKFFTVKQPTLPQIENKFVTRTMLVTTFGRVLLFHENYGDSKLKYEVTTEIDLTNSLIHFVEVITDIKNKPSKGLFAIMSNSLTIAFEVDKTEVSQWTQCLANARLTEKERRVRDFTTSSGTDIYDEETAFAAANLAAVKSRSLSPEPHLTSIQNNISTFPNTLRTSNEEKFHANNGTNTGNSSSSKPVRKLPPIDSKKVIGDGPMISAAVSKAVSMASPNAAVGVGREKGNDNRKKITPMNSKLLARSRMK